MTNRSLFSTLKLDPLATKTWRRAWLQVDGTDRRTGGDVNRYKMLTARSASSISKLCQDV